MMLYVFLGVTNQHLLEMFCEATTALFSASSVHCGHGTPPAKKTCNKMMDIRELTTFLFLSMALDSETSSQQST